MLDEIVKHLEAHSFRFTNEAELQRGIADVLDKHDIHHYREYKLDANNRIDFFCPHHDQVFLGHANVGIEVKVDGARFEVIRQLSRYADLDQVCSLILVTSRRRLADMPRSINMKEVRVVVVGGGF